MAPEIVHPVALSEVPGWVRTLSRTFLNDPVSARTDRWVQATQRDWDPERAWGVRDDGRWVATLSTEARTITVPGRGECHEPLMTDAVTAVTVAATHRRRGLLTRMLDSSLAAARERGDAISILTAAEWPIYGRFGYAPATEICKYTLWPRRPGGRLALEPGRVRHVEREEFGALAPAVFDAARRRRAGQVDCDGPWWDRVLGLDGWPEPPFELPHNYLVHAGERGVDGILAWSKIDGTDDARLAAVEVFGPYAVNDDAERDLWAYLTGLDLVEEVRLDHRPPDEAARWVLPDARVLALTAIVDFVWVKLLDVPAALSARSYSASADIVFELTDDSTAGVAGRYRLSTDGDGSGACEPTTTAPDLTLPQTVLASAYLGGNPIAQQSIAGGLTEHTPGAAARADALFRTALAPWNATGF